MLESHLREHLGQVLRLASSGIDSRKPFATLGLTSLLGLEFRTRLEQSLSLELPASVIWNYSTVAMLAQHLAERLQVPLDTPPEAPAESLHGEPELEAILAEIGQLSAEETRQMLAQGS